MAGAGGCSVAPPRALEDDPAHRALFEALPESARWRAPALAVAPVTLTYLRPGEALYTEDELRGALGEDGAPGEGEAAGGARRQLEDVGGTPSPYSWEQPPLSEEALQRRVAYLVGRALYGDDGELAQLAPGDVAVVASQAVGEDPAAAQAALRALRREALCRAADQARAAIVLHVEVLSCRVAWLRRDGLWWWGSLALLLGGPVPVFPWVPNEVYEVAVTTRVTVHHARSGRLLFQDVYSGTHAQSLNTPQRGVTLPGTFFLDPYFLEPGEGDYGVAFQGLLPHAQKALEERLVAGLRLDLPAALSVPEHRDLLRLGTEETARTYAVVVGHGGPRAGELEARPPLRHAEADARAVAGLLRETGTVEADDHLRRLTGEDATPAAVLAAIEQLAPQALGHDRVLVYYAGYGRRGARGPELVLGGDALALRDLAEACRRTLVERGPAVVFLLDTSFGPEPRGRTHDPVASDPAAGAEPDAPGAYLDVLAQRELGWCVLAAAGPEQAAFEVDARDEESRHGFFTLSLLAALSGQADVAPADGGVLTDELEAFLAEQVPEAVRPQELAEQTPERLGTESPILVGRAPPPGQ